MAEHLFILTGASRGMGLSMARQLMVRGNRLLCLSRHPSAELARDAAQAGVTLLDWRQDLADAQGASERLRAWLLTQASEGFASATLINNAGLIPQIAPLSRVDLANLAQALRVDLEAPMLLTAAFLGATESWGVERKVLNISSGLGRRAMASQAGYCAAKAGMDHFSRCVALDEALKPQGARICSLAPGVIDTDMQVQLRSAPAQDFPDHSGFAQLQQQGMLTSSDEAAARVLAYLRREDFGKQPVADVREA